MDREQLKKSLDTLSPSEEQRRRMLRNIQAQKPVRRTNWFLRAGAAVAALFAVFLIVTQLLPFMGMGRTNAPAAAPQAPDMAVAESAPVAAAEQEKLSAVDYDFLLEHTPWTKDRTPQSLPVFVPSDSVKNTDTGAQTIEGDGFTYSVPAAGSYEEQIVAFLVDATLEQGEAKAQNTGYLALRTVQIRNYDEALAELLEQNTDLTETDVLAGQLLYTEHACELVPVYRFKVKTAVGENFLDITAIK